MSSKNPPGDSLHRAGRGGLGAGGQPCANISLHVEWLDHEHAMFRITEA